MTTVDRDRVEILDIFAFNLTRETFHGEWNYTIKPSP